MNVPKLRFSLLYLFIAIAALAGALACGKHYLDAPLRESIAEQRLVALGARVYRGEMQRRPFRLVEAKGQIEERHLSFRLANQHRICAIALPSQDLTRDDLSFVSTLSGLTHLRLGDHCELSKPQLRELFAAPNLIEVSLRHHTLEIDDLKILSRHRTVSAMDLRGCGIKDQDLAVLATMPKLTAVNLQSNGFLRGKGVRLRDFASLELAFFSHCNLDPEFFADMTKSKLTYLGLGEMKISDETMRQLASCGSLEKISLGNSSVSEDGLRLIAGMKSLKSVWLGGAGLTVSQRARLSSVFPSTVALHIVP